MHVGNVLVDSEGALGQRLRQRRAGPEFLANTKGGWKAYSALELDTNAVELQRGVPPHRPRPRLASVAKFQFDPHLEGHPVEMFVSGTGEQPRRIRAEQLVYNRSTNRR